MAGIEREQDQGFAEPAPQVPGIFRPNSLQRSEPAFIRGQLKPWVVRRQNVMGNRFKSVKISRADATGKAEPGVAWRGDLPHGSDLAQGPLKMTNQRRQLGNNGVVRLPGKPF